jgi:RNA polymerase sigma-70 factor, ECF subfamily
MQNETAVLNAFLSEQPAAALGGLFDLYADRIYRLALGILKDPILAEDVVQETFLSALTHRSQFQGRSGLNTWLYRIAYNACQNHLRQRPVDTLPDEEPDGNDEVKAPLPEALVDWHLTPEQSSLDQETQAELERAISDLPQTLRVVFMLRDIEELSTEETAEALGILPGAVKVRLHRARLMLRERISVYFKERLPG